MKNNVIIGGVEYKGYAVIYAKQENFKVTLTLSNGKEMITTAINKYGEVVIQTNESTKFLQAHEVVELMKK